jgi:hypothetical protein
MLTVHLRVNDSATGKPTPVRLRLVDTEGIYHAPLGRLTEFASGRGEDVGGQVRIDGRAWAYIDGTCEVRLPPGKIIIEISKGPEYQSARHEVDLAPGKLALRLTIERWIDYRAQGWYPGDVRTHELSPSAAVLEGAAEGLAVVQLLARERLASGQRPGAITNLLDFSGTEATLRSDECLVAVNTLNVHPTLGTVSLLHSHRPVFPLRFGAPAEADNWSVADWCDQCHRKKGLVVWPDLPRLLDEHLQGEALAALILGKIDAYEICSFTDTEYLNIKHYYRLLDAGCWPLLVGGSGKDSNAIPLGAVRTYAQLEPGETLTADTWIAAVRAGRTFVTNGPLLKLRVAGQGPGSRISIERGRSVRLHAEAHSLIPFDHLELLVNGEVVASKATSGNRLTGSVETGYLPETSAWIAARCHGADRLATGSCVYAHTTPVSLEIPGRPLVPTEETLGPLKEILTRTRTWVECEARCENARQRQHLVAVLEEAQRALVSRQGHGDTQGEQNKR